MQGTAPTIYAPLVDPPADARFRSLFSTAVADDAVATWRSTIAARCNSLLAPRETTAGCDRSREARPAATWRGTTGCCATWPAGCPTRSAAPRSRYGAGPRSRHQRSCRFRSAAPAMPGSRPPLQRAASSLSGAGAHQTPQHVGGDTLSMKGTGRPRNRRRSDRRGHLQPLDGSHNDTPESENRRSKRSVELTCQHKNREVLVEGPEITVRPVGTRRVAAAGDAR